MLHSYTKIWIHLVWSTKNRVRVIKPEIAPEIHHHIIEYAKKNEIILEILNIQPEHLHCLIELPSDRMLKDIVKTLKGESAHYINENRILSMHFNWQRGYGAFSVSASQYNRVKRYIKNQTEHHHRQSFSEEWNLLLKKYGILN